MPEGRTPPQNMEAIRAAVAERVASEQPAAPATGETLPPPAEDELMEFLRLKEKGDGALFAHLFRGKLICCHDMKDAWFEFGGTSWEPVSIHRVENCVDKVAETYEALLAVMELRFHKMDKDDPEYNSIKLTLKQLRSAIDRQRKPAGLSNTVRFALAAHTPLLMDSAQFDDDPHVFACANGLLSLARGTTGEFSQARPSNYIRRHSPFPWESIEAACPQWESFVLEIVGGNQEIADFLQRLFGYAITGLANERIFTMLTGEGSNGKTLLIETLSAILGDYMDSVPPELLLDQGKSRSADQPTPTIMSLRRLRVAFASETEEHRRFSSARVKWLSGNDTLVGRSPYKEENISFKPSHTLLLLTNHRPHAPAGDFALWDRLRLVDFPNKYVDKPDKPNEKQRDYDLPDRLLSEAPGILAWLIKGLIYYYEQGLNPPPAVLDATREYQHEEDIYGQFVEDVCAPEPGNKLSPAVLHAAFANWFEENISRDKKKTPTPAAIGRHLGKKLHKEKVGGKVLYYDIRLRDESGGGFSSAP